MCFPPRVRNLGLSSGNTVSSHALEPGTFIVNAELQIGLIVVVVFVGAGGCVRGCPCHQRMARPQVPD